MLLARPQEARTGGRPDGPQFATYIACTSEFRTQTELFVEDSVDADAVIDSLSTRAFAEDQTKDSREHAHTSNFGRHSRANLQRDCNFTDCQPSFPVDPFDHRTTSTFAIVFEAATPITLQHLSRTIFLCPCAPMLAQRSTSRLCSLLTCFMKSSIFELGLAIFSFHQECRVFRT